MINRIHNHSGLGTAKTQKSIDRAVEFNKILRGIEADKDLKISSHAANRLRERNITLTDKDLVNLNAAVGKLRDKGGRESLIVYRNIAFITSIKNNMIITAVDSESLNENIFTNIDSAMLL